MYQMTPPQKPVQPKKKVSPIQWLLILAALAFAGWYAYQALAPVASPYATIEAGTLGARYSGDALIVRNEIPYDAEGVSNVNYIAEEGSLLHRGSAICNVYSSGFSTRERTTLQADRDQIKDYQMQLLGSETTYDAKMDRLVSDVLDRARELQLMISGQKGNLPNQEKLLQAALEARQNYLKKKYATDQRLNRLYDDEQSQMQRIDSWTKQYAATSEGLVSFYSDGYEYALNESTYTNFNPAQVRAMIAGQKPEQSTIAKGKTTIYRTVRDTGWHVLMLVRDNALWNPIEGQSYELKLERFESTVVHAKVESFTRNGGELLVVLAVPSEVTPVLYLRSCGAELGDYVQSLRVPARALYTQNNMTGVVVVDGQNKAFTPVNVLTKDGDFVYIAAVQQGLLYEGQTVLLF